MITPDVAQLIAADRSAQLQRAAAGARLAAIARCCRPGTWTRVTRALTGLRTALRSGPVAGTACCAAA